MIIKENKIKTVYVLIHEGHREMHTTLRSAELEKEFLKDFDIDAEIITEQYDSHGNKVE